MARSRKPKTTTSLGLADSIDCNGTRLALDDAKQNNRVFFLL